MSSGSTLILALVAVIIMCVAVSAASRRQATAWNFYHFDGRAFVAGRPVDGSPFLAVRDRDVPLVLTLADQVEATPLPAGKGALAGICYLRSSGGKLAGVSSFAPRPAAALEISSGDAFVLRSQTDGFGYFVALLPAGAYRISCGGFAAEATIEAGKTTLATVQAGKRMVD